MTDYKGNRCPVCEKTFKENDDIVVCPDCGTPYHRECWKKVGACLHEAEHAAGFEWTPDNVISGGPEDLVCPNCGTHNPLGAKFCNHCGVSLPDHPDNVQHRERPGRQWPGLCQSQLRCQRQRRTAAQQRARPPSGGLFRRGGRQHLPQGAWPRGPH